MTLSDTLYESLDIAIDSCIPLYAEDEMLEVAENSDILEYVACTLKIINRRGYLRPSEKELKKINSIDWTQEARNYIINYVESNYMS